MNPLIIAVAWCSAMTGCDGSITTSGVTATSMPMPKPVGAVNEDFIRGACYAADALNHFQPMPEGVSVSVMIGDKTITCPHQVYK